MSKENEKDQEKAKINKGRDELLKFFELMKSNRRFSINNLIPLDNKGFPSRIDFEVNYGKRKIGIELTEFYRQINGKPILHKIGLACEEFSNKLDKETFNKLCGGELFLKPSVKCPNPHGEEFTKFLNELFNLIHNEKDRNPVLFVGIQRNLYKKYAYMYPTLVKYLYGVQINKSGFVGSWTFLLASTGSVKEFMDNLLMYVNKKVKKHKNYLKYNHFDETWLIILFGKRSSQMTPPLDHIKGTDFQSLMNHSQFNRIYLYFLSQRKVISLVKNSGEIVNVLYNF